MGVHPRTDDEELLVVANCGREPREVDLPSWHGAKLVLGNLPGTADRYEGSSTTLAAWDARIYRRKLG